MQTQQHRLRRWFGALLAPAPSVSETLEISAPTPVVTSAPAQPIPPAPAAQPEPIAATAQAEPEPLAYQARAWSQAGGLPQPLKQLSPREHAQRLLAWMAEPLSAECAFAHVREAYNDMCSEEWIEPHTWVCVARHFTPLTGGKRYRSAVDPRTGLRDARERVYTIPSAADLSKPVRPVAQPAVKLVQPIRRAA